MKNIALAAKRNRYIKRALALFCGVLLLFPASCAARKESMKMTAVFKANPAEVEFWEISRQGLLAAAEEFGIELSIVGVAAETMVEEQITLVNNIVSESPPDAMILVATDYERMAQAAKNAVDAGIRLISLDSDVNCEGRISFVSSDNREIGRQLCDELIKQTGKSGKIAVVGHVEATTTGKERVLGIQEALEKYPDITLTEIQYCDNLSENAKNIALDIIARHPDIIGFIGTNEGSNIGVANALKEAGMAGRIKLVGCDNSRRQVQLLEQNIIQAIVIQRPFNMGYTAVSVAMDAALKKETPAFVKVDCVVITRENMYSPENQKLLFPFWYKDAE